MGKTAIDLTPYTKSIIVSEESFEGTPYLSVILTLNKANGEEYVKRLKGFSFDALEISHKLLAPVKESKKEDVS